MPLLPYFALLLALAGSPLLLALFKRLHFSPFSPVARASLWATSGVVLAIAAAAGGGWLAYSGVAWPTWSDLGLATLAAAATFTAFGLSQHVQRMLGTSSPKQMEQYANIIRLSYSHRVFLVVTAAVTEEVLYRGYAIGVGQHLLGSVWLAGVVSVAAFTLAHLRWGLAHLFPVFTSALILTLLFAFTHNLLACVIAHAIVDGVGFLVLPAIVARRQSRPLPNVG